MAFKLVYTSAPKGLKEGSFGFCTVGCSRNLSERTIAALEAFSGYRRLFVDAERAAQNPVAYSHVLLDDGETTLRVLSRIADAGLDYSDRSNKIASHLVLGHTELRDAGPAAFFEEPELFEKRWEGSPQIFDAPFVLPRLTPKASNFEEWKKTTGDPGWAGVLASTVYTDRPVVLIARPEHNVLALYQEALSLLSPAMRWQATFSTYYAKTPPGIQCQWKATMLGSSESQTLRAIPYVLVLDLASPFASLRPESVDSSSQTSRLIAVARERANEQAVASSEKVSRLFDVQTIQNNNAAPSEFSQNQEQEGEKEEPESSPNKSLATSTKKILDYGRKLPLKNYFEKKEEDGVRWRLFGATFVGVFALLALIFMGLDFIADVSKNVQNMQEDAKSVQVSKNDDESKEIDYSDSNDQTSQNAESSLFVDQSSEEVSDDPFNFEEEKATEQDKEDRTKYSTSQKSDVLASDSKTKEKKVKEEQEETSSSKKTSDSLAVDSKAEEKKANGGTFIEGADLRKELSRSPLLDSNRRPQFLTSEEYQTTIDFKKLVEERRLSVDFNVFQRGTDKTVETLIDEIDEEAQEIFSDILKLCRKFNGKLEITCDLSADQNNERRWLDSKRRTDKKQIDFSTIRTSDSVKTTFKTLDANDAQNGSLSIMIDSLGKLTFSASDEETRNYFLSSSSLKWTVIVPNPETTGKEFVVETKNVQLLRPFESDFLKDSKTIASVIELSNGGLLPLVVPSSLSYYDPIRNAKQSPALLVLLNPASTPSAFNVESQMDDKKKSIVFIFKLKAENVDAFKIRFTRNSKVVRSETIFDKDALNVALEEYFSSRAYQSFLYDSDASLPQAKRQNALQKVESSLARSLMFDFYLVSTTGREQKDQNKRVFLGSASVKPQDLDQKEK